MDEFLSIGTDAMSSDETVKIEPTLTATETPAPAETKAESEPAKSEPEAVKLESAAPETKAEAPAIEATAEVKAEAPKDQPKIEAVLPKSEPSLPPAPQIEPVVLAFKNPEATAATTQSVPARSSRFALLAASVAIAASFGAI